MRSDQEYPVLTSIFSTISVEQATDQRAGVRFEAGTTPKRLGSPFVSTSRCVFSRVQFSRKLKEGRGGDPILPAGAYFDKGLDAELQELGVPRNQVACLSGGGEVATVYHRCESYSLIRLGLSCPRLFTTDEGTSLHGQPLYPLLHVLAFNSSQESLARLSRVMDYLA